jgi:hypothetical protein
VNELKLSTGREVGPIIGLRLGGNSCTYVSEGYDNRLISVMDEIHKEWPEDCDDPLTLGEILELSTYMINSWNELRDKVLEEIDRDAPPIPAPVFKENHVYAYTLDGKTYFFLYRNSQFGVLSLDHVLMQTVTGYSIWWDEPTDLTRLRLCGKLMPLWKRILTFGLCGWYKVNTNIIHCI